MSYISWDAMKMQSSQRLMLCLKWIRGQQKQLEALQIVNVMEEDHKTSAEHIWEYKTETKTPKCTQLSKVMQMKNQHGEIESLKALEN